VQAQSDKQAGPREAARGNGPWAQASTLFVADPSPIFLLGFSRVGQQGGVRVVTVASAAALRRSTRPRTGDLLLANPALWAVDGWRRLHELHVGDPGLAVGALVDQSRQWEVERAMQAGYRAYLDKRLLTPELLPAAVGSLLTGGSVYLSGPHPDAPALPARELEVLALLGEGYSVQGIAERLFLGERTVKAVINSVTRRLGAANRVEAVAMGYRYGLLPAAEPGAGRMPLV
jgi:DNA-binding NarL/FixJ family response regulator